MLRPRSRARKQAVPQRYTGIRTRDQMSDDDLIRFPMDRLPVRTSARARVVMRDWLIERTRYIMNVRRTFDDEGNLTSERVRWQPEIWFEPREDRMYEPMTPEILE